MKSAIAIMQARKQLETPFGAALLNNLGELHYQLGRYADAIPYYERAISIARTAGAQPQSAISYRNLGIFYQLRGRAADAIEAYKNSIAILSRLPGERIQLASTLNNVATLFEDQKRFGDAEKLLQQALAIYQAALGDNHLYVATAYNRGRKDWRKASGPFARVRESLLGQSLTPAARERQRGTSSTRRCIS